MTERILGPEGSRRRRRFLWVPMVLVACTALFLVAGAQAVHNTKFFQLDGDAAAGTVPTGVTTNGVEDWDTICAAHLGTPDPANTPGPTCHTAAGQTLPSGGTLSDRSAFITDAFKGTTDNIYKGGTDDADVNTWSWKEATPSPPKADIEQAFAAQYTCTAALQSTGKCSAGSDFLNHKYLYFGGTRFANNGDTNIGLWFFHNRVTVAGANTTTDSTGIRCVPSSGCGFGTTDTAGSAAPVHTAGNCSLPGHPTPCTPGDLFVQSAFTSKPSIKIFEWVGPGNATKDYNGTNGCITSACTLQPVQFVLPAGATDNRCETTGTGTVDQGCAIVNSGEIQSPWVFQDSSSSSPANKIEAGELFEGGLDLTALGFGDECISSVLLNTRSSGSSVNSVAQDFALGQFGSCTSTVVTTPSITSDTLIPATGTIANVTDTAAVDAQGITTWSANVTFHLCGPDDLTAQTNCKTGGTAITGGTATNSSKNVTSAGATITKVGKYCWRANAHFTIPATGVPDATDPDPTADSQSECFNITPRLPTLATQASGPVALGNPISDTATLGNTANRPGSPVINPTTAGGPAQGTITIKVFGPDSCTTSAHADFTLNVTSGDSTYGPVSFTPSAVGQYVFVASYSGDPPNTSAQPGQTCANQPSNEKVIVSSSSVVTTPSITSDTIIPATGTISVTDSATVTVNGATTWSGNVRFHLCGPDDLTSQNNCTTGGTLVGGDKAVSNGSATAVSDAATITKVGKYCWRGDFLSSTTGVPNSSDPSNTTSQSECFNITPRQPTLTTQVVNATVTLGNPIQDNATLGNTANRPGSPVINPTTAGGPAQGTITIKVFGPDSCLTSAHADFTVNVNGDGTYGPVGFTPSAIGQYVFVASYSGDSPNTLGVAATACGSQPDSEKVTVIGNAHASSVQDWLPNDTVTLTGDSNLNGSLTITLYPGDSCSVGGSVQPVPNMTFPITVTNGDKAGASYSTNNTQFKVSTTGTTHWSWLVQYHDNVQTSPLDSCSEVTTLAIAN